MFTRTTELAFRALLVLALDLEPSPASPRRISAHLRCSPTYLSKTLGLLVKAGILASQKGSAGGVSLARKSEDVTMLSVVEACEGPIRPNHCPLRCGRTATCSFHMAVDEIHRNTVKVLSRYTLADLSGRSRRLMASTSGCRLAVLATEPATNSKLQHRARSSTSPSTR